MFANCVIPLAREMSQRHDSTQDTDGNREGCQKVMKGEYPTGNGCNETEERRAPHTPADCSNEFFHGALLSANTLLIYLSVVNVMEFCG